MDTFDRIRQQVIEFGAVMPSRPRLIITDPSSFSNEATAQYTVEIARVDEPGGDPRLTGFVTIGDADGFTRVVLPHDVVEAIYQQRVRAFDRSTPQSRDRARRHREAVARRRELHARGRHDKKRVASCPDCQAQPR